MRAVAACLTLLSGVGLALMMVSASLAEERLEQARTEAAGQGLLEHLPVVSKVGMGPWLERAEGWVNRLPAASPGTAGLVDLADEAQLELLALGDDIAALAPGVGLRTAPVGTEPSAFSTLRVGQLLCALARGDAPDRSAEERRRALLAAVHLAAGLLDRDVVDLMVSITLLQDAERAYRAAPNLHSEAQRKAIDSVLGTLDLDEVTRRVHARAVSLQAAGQAEDSSAQDASPGWKDIKGYLSRLSGRDMADEARMLELASATQVYLRAETSAEEARAERVHRDMAEAIDGDLYPLAWTMGVELQESIAAVRGTVQAVEAWRRELQGR